MNWSMKMMNSHKLKLSGKLYALFFIDTIISLRFFFFQVLVRERLMM